MQFLPYYESLVSIVHFPKEAFPGKTAENARLSLKKAKDRRVQAASDSVSGSVCPEDGSPPPSETAEDDGRFGPSLSAGAEECCASDCGSDSGGRRDELADEAELSEDSSPLSAALSGADDGADTSDDGVSDDGAEDAAAWLPSQ